MHENVNAIDFCSALEQEQQNYLNLVDTIAQDLTPLGKMQSEQNNEDSDAESAASDGNESTGLQVEAFN
jgi:Anaphase-promoting complex subunit 15